MTTTAAPIAALPAPVDAPSWAAATWPLGAHFDANSSSTTFAVTAPAATRVQLEIYARATGAGPVAVVDAQRGPDGTWRGGGGG
ncbi:hypothetical protein, partial [Nostocoides australiense]|uniref:hypothetical protein n=1 Tax=Nostocoides australiense TaxID=99480 RepID=UPI0006610C71